MIFGKAQLENMDEKFGTSEWDYQEASRLNADLYGDSVFEEYQKSHPQSELDLQEEMMRNGNGDKYASVEEWKNDPDSDYKQLAEAFGWKDESDSGIKEAIAQGVEEGNENIDEEKKGALEGKLDTDNLTINAGTVNMQGELNTPQEEKIKTIESGQNEGENTDKEQKDEEENNSIKEANVLELEEGERNLKDLLTAARDSGVLGKFADIGNELYKGAHSITDTMYVDGGATGDWQQLSGIAENLMQKGNKKIEERNERTKASWANDKANISFVADKYMVEMRAIYQGKSEAYVRDKAEEKAKSKLKEMSEFVPYGITNVEQVYQLYNDKKEYACSTEQAIKRAAGYNKFNVENVTHINQGNAFTRNDYKTVQEAIPGAEKYYKSGVTDIKEMEIIERMRRELEKIPEYSKKATPQFAMKVDQTLKKKGGKINYKGSDEAVKKVVDSINEKYGG